MARQPDSDEAAADSPGDNEAGNKPRKKRRGLLKGRSGAKASGDTLHLLAFDGDDLAIVSAHLQDAITRVADMAYLPRDNRFAMVTSRFDWSKAGTGALQRRMAGLHFDHVRAVQRSGFTQSKPDLVLNLLSIVFEPGDAPAGHITLLFSAGAAIRLDVECIDCQLNDMTSGWRARARPVHDLQDDSGPDTQAVTDEALPDGGSQSK